jgi:hypothetical protein
MQSAVDAPRAGRRGDRIVRLTSGTSRTYARVRLESEMRRIADFARCKINEYARTALLEEGNG